MSFPPFLQKSKKAQNIFGKDFKCCLSEPQPSGQDRWHVWCLPSKGMTVIWQESAIASLLETPNPIKVILISLETQRKCNNSSPFWMKLEVMPCVPSYFFFCQLKETCLFSSSSVIPYALEICIYHVCCMSAALCWWFLQYKIHDISILELDQASCFTL